VSGAIEITPFEMAIPLIRAGVRTPPYPRPLGDGSTDSALLLAAYIHLCDAWEFHVTCMYQAQWATEGSGPSSTGQRRGE